LLYSVFGPVMPLMWPLRITLDSFLSATQALNAMPYKTIDELNVNGFETLLLFIAVITTVLLCIKKRGIYLCLLALTILLWILF
jgi:hypothetical protein